MEVAGNGDVSQSRLPRKRLGGLTKAGFARVDWEQCVTWSWEVKLGRKAVRTVGADDLEKWGGCRVGVFTQGMLGGEAAVRRVASSLAKELSAMLWSL